MLSILKGANRFNHRMGDGTTTHRCGSNSPGLRIADLPYHDLGGSLYFTLLAAGDNYACGIQDNGDTKCWGGNQYGMLGTGGTAPNPGPISSIPAVNFGSGTKAVFIHAGFTTNCAVLDNGKTK